MDWQTAMRMVVARTGVQRYRELCVDDAHPVRAEKYRALMIRLATAGSAPAPTRPPAAETIAAMKLVNACPHRSRDAGCGCSGHRCALGKGKVGIVAHRECLICVGLPVAG